MNKIYNYIDRMKNIPEDFVLIKLREYPEPIQILVPIIILFVICWIAL